MAFILTSDDDPELDAAGTVQQFHRRYDAYRAYLGSVRNALPTSAYEFATASWREDNEDHRNVHDSWVESLTILEPSSGERHENRSLEIHVRLLGPYHDGHMVLIYRGVQSYELSAPQAFKGPPLNVGHGDWLADEVRLSESNLVQHEVEFSRGTSWSIECRDIEWAWHPKHSSPDA